MNIANKRYNEITFRGAKWLLLFVFYLQFLIPLLLETKWVKYMKTQTPDFLIILSIQIFAIFVPCLVFMYLNNADFEKGFKLKAITAPQGVMCALIGASAQSVASVLNIPVFIFIKNKTGQLPAMATPAPENMRQLLLFLLLVALIPAMFEEILMRGIVLTTTQKKGYRASLLIGGLYFALLHNQIESIAGHFFIGIVLCYIVWMTESVLGGIIAHFSFNSFGILLNYLISVKSAQIPLFAGNAFYITVTAVSIILFFLFFGTINRKRVKRNKSHRLARQIIFSVLNFPVILIALGYVMFQLMRY